MAPQLAWIGLGNMGRGMVKNLAEKGPQSSPILIYNRTAKRAHDLHAKTPNTTVVESIDDVVAKADIIFICLLNDAAVTSTVETLTNSGKLKGKLVVDCSTIHPETTSAVAKSITSAGAEFVACPVFGAPAMADAGQLVCVLAGPSAAVEKVKPYCTGVMGRTILDFSDQEPSQASLQKLIGNTFILSMVTTLSEGHVLAEKSGLGVEQLHKFVEVMFPGPYVAYSNRLKSGDYYKREEPLFSVDGARKDAKHAQNIAKDAGMEMKLVKLADGYLGVVQGEMGKRGDIASIYGAKRKEAGLPFEN